MTLQTKMTLQIKNALTIVLSAGIGLSSGWLVRAAYQDGEISRPIVCLVLSVILQIGLLVFVQSKEEQELDLLREMRLAKNRQKLAETEQLSARIQEELKAGRLESAIECMNIRDRFL